MMSETQITEFDLFFLSYDEPNAEKHWADLIDKAPWAKRVHGVKGFAAAHRACAMESETDWFITVDADNIVVPGFFDISVTVSPEHRPFQCYSWNGRNMLNGLKYGNGGLKLWSKAFVMSDRIGHEVTGKSVDFCWDQDYQQINQTFSEVWPNASSYQAFRAGFREGVKLTLDRGERVEARLMKEKLHPINLRNLKIWCSVGCDIENGDWANYGALLGWSKMLDPNFDHTIVSDFQAFKTIWLDAERTFDYFVRLKNLRYDIRGATGIELPELDDAASEFFRETFTVDN